MLLTRRPEVGLEEWIELYLDPKNARLLSGSIGDIVVETAWVGIAHSTEQEPKLYLTRMLEHQDKRSRGRALESWWTRNETEARAKYAECMTALAIK